jgi:hypothetical protein
MNAVGLPPIRIFDFFTLLWYKHTFFWEIICSDWLIWCFDSFIMILGRVCEFRRVFFFFFLKEGRRIFGKVMGVFLRIIGPLAEAI